MIGKKQPPEPGLKVRWRGGNISLAQRRDFIQQLQNLTGEAPALPMELNPKEFQGFHLALLNKVGLDYYLHFFNMITFIIGSCSDMITRMSIGFYC